MEKWLTNILAEYDNLKMVGVLIYIECGLTKMFEDNPIVDLKFPLV